MVRPWQPAGASRTLFGPVLITKQSAPSGTSRFPARSRRWKRDGRGNQREATIGRFWSPQRSGALPSKPPSRVVPTKAPPTHPAPAATETGPAPAAWRTGTSYSGDRDGHHARQGSVVSHRSLACVIGGDAGEQRGTVPAQELKFHVEPAGLMADRGDIRGDQPRPAPLPPAGARYWQDHRTSATTPD